MSVQGIDYMPFDYPDYDDIRLAQQSFDTLAVCAPEDMNLTGRGEAERIFGAFVSASMFKLTGVPFIVGRPFTEDEDKPGGPRVVILSERFWRTHFNADPAIVGTTVMVSGRPLEVLGVAPTQAFEWTPMDLYIPVHLQRRADFQSRDQHILWCVGRLKHGVSRVDAERELTAIYHDISARFPNVNKGYRIRATPLWTAMTTLYAPTMRVLGASVACLFLIANANIANLVLTKTLDRQNEIAIRTALGASRGRLLSLLLSESVFLSLLGAAAGLLIAVWAIDLIKALSPTDTFARFGEVEFDTVPLLFFAAASVLSSLFLGLFPGLILTRDRFASALKYKKGTTFTVGLQQRWAQSALIMAQVAFTCVVCLVAGLLVRTMKP